LNGRQVVPSGRAREVERFVGFASTAIESIVIVLQRSGAGQKASAVGRAAFYAEIITNCRSS